jgi:hypothetical protein
MHMLSSSIACAMLTMQLQGVDLRVLIQAGAPPKPVWSLLAAGTAATVAVVQQSVPGDKGMHCANQCSSGCHAQWMRAEMHFSMSSCLSESVQRRGTALDALHCSTGMYMQQCIMPALAQVFLCCVGSPSWLPGLRRQCYMHMCRQ